MLPHDVTGTGSPLLLLHSGATDRRMWDGVRSALSEWHTVIAPDLRGFGRSPLPDSEFSHVDDVLELFDGLGVRHAPVVGASFGGLVALQLAAAAPERVDALVLAAPPLPGWAWSDAMMEFAEAEDAAMGRGDLEAAVEANVSYWAGGAEPAVRAAVREMQRTAFELQRGSTAEERSHPVDPATIPTRTLVLVGEAENADFTAIADHLARTMPNATKSVVAGAGHFIPMERPAEFVSRVLGFVDSR